MEDVRPTRAELLERRQRIAVAEQGMELLKRKRDALVGEFMSIMDATLKSSAALERALAEAQYSLAIAQAVDGMASVRSAALATRAGVEVEIGGTKVMGVAIPVVTRGVSPLRTRLGRGYAITGVSSRIDETAERFEHVLDLVIECAGVETRLRRLGDEIQTTNRRVNALEQITIPELCQQVAVIEQTLEERAREDHFRLKHLKRALVRGR